MPFTDPWSELIPDDSTLADLLGADIRQLRLDIRERMNVAFVDWTADPLVVQPTVIGKNAGIVVTIPFSAFYGAAAIDTTNGFVSIATGQVIVAPIRVPYGCTIVQISVLCNPGIGDTLTASIYRRLFSNAAAAGVSVYDLPCNAVGLQATLSGAINHLLDPAYYYWLYVNNIGGNVANLHAIKFFISRDTNDHST